MVLWTIGTALFQLVSAILSSFRPLETLVQSLDTSKLISTIKTMGFSNGGSPWSGLGCGRRLQSALRPRAPASERRQWCRCHRYHPLLLEVLSRSGRIFGEMTPPPSFRRVAAVPEVLGPELAHPIPLCVQPGSPIVVGETAIMSAIKFDNASVSHPRCTR